MISNRCYHLSIRIQYVFFPTIENPTDKYESEKYISKLYEWKMRRKDTRKRKK